MTVFWAILVSLLGAVSLVAIDRKTSYFFHYCVRFFIYFILTWLIQYNALMPFEFMRVTTIILIYIAISNAWDIIAENDYYRKTDAKGMGGIITCCFFLFCMFVGNCDGWRAQNLYKVVEANRLEASAFSHKPIDENHIRAVPIETAMRIARQTISEGGENYGAFFSFEEETMSIQKVNNRLYWVAPMEFGGLFKEMNSSGSPGFIMISAENENEPPRLVTKKADGKPIWMRYLMSSWFSDSLERLMFNRHPKKLLTDFTFEVDEQLNPWQVITVINNFASYDFYEILGVLIVNPETGEEKYYAQKDIPQWIDRVIPEDIAFNYFYWWGMYKKGWAINREFNPDKDIRKPTEVGGIGNSWMVYGSDGEPYWFTGYTSYTAKDQALVGKGFMNTRTGKFYYVSEGVKGATEERVISDIIAAMQKQNVAIKATAPIPYNLYGKPNCWVVPVVSESADKDNSQAHSGGKLLKIAIVDGETAGSIILADTKNEALLQFKRRLSGQGIEVAISDTSKLTDFTGELIKVTQITVGGNTIFRFSLRGSDKTFSCDYTTADAMPTSIELANPGDKITVKFEETKERIVQVSRFQVESQPVIESPNQTRLNESIRQQKETERAWDKSAKPTPEKTP